jgi:hypothetical protein
VAQAIGLGRVAQAERMRDLVREQLTDTLGAGRQRIERD